MNEIEYPRVLIISHNVLSNTTNMGKTMASFFKGWDKKKLAQIYFHSEISNTDICDSHYRITDFDLLESLFTRKKPGKVIDKNVAMFNSNTTRVDSGLKSDIYQLGRKRKPILYLIRNSLWDMVNWKTKPLQNWIEEFNPQVLFYAAGDYSFSIKIAINISKSYKLPLIVFFGDEYYFIGPNKFSFIQKINYAIYKKVFNQMFECLEYYITASDKMSRKYLDFFKKRGDCIMTPTTFLTPVKNNKLKISFIGNIGLARWKMLLEIGKVIKDKGLVIDLYSGEKDKHILNFMTLENGIRFHGQISAKNVETVLKESTVLIHVESMEDEIKRKTRYSMSTKIAESLASGVCLFAYGPDDISSIEYLIENNAACVVTKKEDLRSKLYEIIDSEELRRKYIKNAKKLASERHDFHKNTQLFYKIIMKSLNNKEGVRYENSSS